MNGGVFFFGRSRRRGDTFFADPLFQDLLRRLRRKQLDCKRLEAAGL